MIQRVNQTYALRISHDYRLYTLITHGMCDMGFIYIYIRYTYKYILIIYIYIYCTEGRMNPGVIIPRPVCKTSATDGHLYHASSAARSRKTSPLPSSASLALIIIPCSLDCTYFQDRSVLYTDSQSDKPVQFGL